MAERVDVCIVGSGFGGAIAAWRLAELYRASGTDPAAILVLERGKRKAHTDFRQSMDIGTLSDSYGLIQGQGAQVVLANLVGGGSNLYLAASLRAPGEVFERRDHHPNDGPDRRMWPKAISRRSLDPFYRRAEAGLRVERPGWDRVSKSGGAWAAMLDDAGHTCDRVPAAISLDRCVDAKWCHTGCIFGAKNTLLTNYLGAAERAGVQVRELMQAEEVRPSSARPYRWTIDVNAIDPATKQPAGLTQQVECKVLILAAGAMGTPPIMLRSQRHGGLAGASTHVGKHLGSNGDHVGGVELDPHKLRKHLGLPGYGQFYKGRPITTMSYDWWVGKRGHRHDGTRFTLQEIFLSQLTNFLYDDGRGGGEPSWWGREKKRSISTWNNHIEILAMVEDTNDGEFVGIAPTGSHVQPNGGPIGVGDFTYAFSEQSHRVREMADDAIRSVVERRGLGRYLKLTESQGAYIAHPLGGCRMGEDAGLGVVDDHCEVFGAEGLFCMDSSAIPTSLGVNPSLTIAAVCERAAGKLAARADDFGLPVAPADLRHRRPPEHVGPRVKPARSGVGPRTG